ncbi:hypothetical protein SMQC20_29010 [Serratia marcescens]|nr:hypothetical protein SMQC20_29010 [Serratia marcescens]
MMTKAKFFELLNHMAKRENAKAEDFTIYTLVESEERQAEMLAKAGRRTWFFNAIGFSCRNCWHVCAQDHNTVEAFNRNLPKFTRWLNEWKEAKSAEEHIEAQARSASSAKPDAIRTVLGKVISSITGCAVSYGRHQFGKYHGRRNIHFSASAYSFNGLSSTDVATGCYSIVNFAGA